MKIKYLLGLIFSIYSLNLTAQTFKQNISGKITDLQSNQPINNAFVEVLDSNKSIASSFTDAKGYYKILNVPVGRINIKVSANGYAEMMLNNVVHISGKETVLDIELSEKINQIKSVSVKSKKGINNGSISVSAKSFDIEDTKRFAGSRNDPARMASNFAGVVGNNDSRNDIIIRGNSPQGLLWKMEGLDIPNPNHFGSMGASGGPVSILNNNVLAKSDFLISAFPAMYGNALAGVFDLQMRSGNKNKMEYTGQIGFNGFEFGIEGPISKIKKSSFILNYRLSNLYVLSKIGLNFGTGTAIPNYQDITFKLDLPLGKHKLSFFGIGGTSNVHFTEKDNQDTTNFYGNSNSDLKYKTNMGVVGATYTHFVNSKANIKTSIGTTYTGVITAVDSVWDGGSRIDYRDNSSLVRHILNSAFNYKQSARSNYSLGLNIQNSRFKFKDSFFNQNKYFVLRNEQGNTSLLQLYATNQYKFNEETILNLGIHYQYLVLNGSQAIEPRIGISHQLNSNVKLSAGSGMHSQMQPLQMYFLKTKVNGVEYSTNKELGFTKSIHNVLALDYKINKTWRHKTEIYYQYLYDIPVTQYSSYYSAVNEGTDFNTPNTDSLVNNGTSKNYGIEFTFEKNFNKGFYFLNTISLFQSKYKGSNGIERNTAYNNNYVVNLLAGKEIKLNEKNTIAFDTKIVLAGGKRYTPIDEVNSKLLGKEIQISKQTFEKQFDEYFRLDFKITYRRSGKHITQEWFADIQNITNKKNVFLQQFDNRQGKVVTQYQLGFFPNINYRINF